MDSILINPQNEQEFKFVSQLLNKLGVVSKIFTDEEKEDLGLSILMKDTDQSEKVPESEILKTLLDDES